MSTIPMQPILKNYDNGVRINEIKSLAILTDSEARYFGL